MKAVRVDSISDLRENRIAGSYEILQVDEMTKGVRFICPCGCGNESYLPIRTKDETRGWDWNEDENEPTLRPSVYNTGMPCKWHGFLTSGEWVSV